MRNHNYVEMVILSNIQLIELLHGLADGRIKCINVHISLKARIYVDVHNFRGGMSLCSHKLPRGLR